jgi:uncharacterized membrane protein HdeD (DUF308 family)
MNKFLQTLSDYIDQNNYLAFGMVYLLIGILIIIYNNALFSSFMEIILLVMLLSCVKDLLQVITKKNKTKLTLTKAFINTVVVLISLIFVDIPKAIFIMIFASYLVFNGVAKLFNFFLLKLDKIKGYTNECIEGLLYFIFGMICFFSPMIHMETMLSLIGTYLIVLGINYLIDFLDQKNIHLKRIRVPLPVIVDAFIPFSILQKLNRIGKNETIEYDFKKNNKTVDLEIFVHVSEKGMGKFGHVDLCFKGEVISYGNYDMDTRKLREGIGSGVVFTTNKNDYIRFCVNDNNKTLFVFGIQLNKIQEEKVKTELDKIKEQLVEWNPKYVRALKEGKKPKKQEYQDYASMLYKKTKAKFYKFKSGKLKTYFVLGNNCGTLVDKILRSSGAGVLKMYGIITPGTYYDFLEREYMKKGSNVVSKVIYNKNNIDKLKNR